MKKLQKISDGQNYTALNVGAADEVIQYELPLGPHILKGKVFVGQALGLTGADVSYQTLVPGQDGGFYHSHKTHEELYIIIKGKGEYQVDGDNIPIQEGSLIRVAPKGLRTIRNNGTENLTMICVQYKANSFTEGDSPMEDGIISDQPLKW
jgi:uncharacterized cupin superfamily protein